MKLDTHVHTFHSGRATVFPFNHFMRECYNTPEAVYDIAKRRGMDLVVITDHDQISGAVALGERDDVLVGCEVTAFFPADGVKVHMNVLDITPGQFAEIDRLRHDIHKLLPYLHRQDIYVSLNHVASGINGPLTAAHVAAILPWVNGMEVVNGTRLSSQNRTALCVAKAAGKHLLAGSDSHTHRGIGYTWTEVPGARTKDEFMAGLRAGRSVAGGKHGGRQTLVSDMCRFAGNFMKEAVSEVANNPADWRAHAQVIGGTLAMPIVPLCWAGALVHFFEEQQFNRELLFDLVSLQKQAPALAEPVAA